MPDVWYCEVEADYIEVEPRHWEMYPAITWVGDWWWITDLENGRSLFGGNCNDQVKGELGTSPNVVLHSAVLQE